MPDRWEYLTLRAGLWGNLRDMVTGRQYGRFSAELLDRLGNEGWELCGIQGPTLIFKRRREPAGARPATG